MRNRLASIVTLRGLRAIAVSRTFRTSRRLTAVRASRPLSGTSASRPARALTIAIAFSLLLLALAAPAALAAPLAQDAPGDDNLGYLLAGTLLTWAGFFAYAVYLARKNRDLRREVEDLRRTLGERE